MFVGTVWAIGVYFIYKILSFISLTVLPEPVIPKLGECPIVEPSSFGICVQECDNDNGCSGEKKCCSNGCGNTCMDPLLPEGIYLLCLVDLKTLK